MEDLLQGMGKSAQFYFYLLLKPVKENLTQKNKKENANIDWQLYEKQPADKVDWAKEWDFNLLCDGQKLKKLGMTSVLEINRDATR